MTPSLKGVRILSVEQYGAGPFGTQHLADLGAEVIKVENHRLGGDYARDIGPYFADGADDGTGSLFFQAFNRNKKSLSLDLTHDEGRAVFHRLVAGADAVANNLRGDVAEKLGLTYGDLKVHNAAIVCTHCSAYGRQGPRRDWPGFDFLMQAEAGYFTMSGEPDTPPTRMGLSIVDYLAGTYMALGLLAGVLGARRDGMGRDIDVNLYETALSNLSYQGVWALNTDYAPQRVARSAHAALVPCQLYKTADSWIYLMCNKEKFWPLLCQIIDRPELAQDRRFKTFADRLNARDEITELLDEALSAATTAEWMVKFAGVIPAAPIRTPREALADPALKGKIGEMKNGGDRPGIRTLTSPIDDGSSFEGAACPPMGFDTDEILRSAGVSDDEIEALKRSGAI